MPQSNIGELAVLCGQMREAARAVIEGESELVKRKNALLAIATEDIPALMSELSIQELVLDTGETVSVALEVYAAIPKARLADAMKWLEDNNFGGLIKTELNLSFDRGQAQAALDLAEKLNAEGFEVESTAGVHPQTLKAFVKERLGANEPVPEDLFGVRSVNTAKLKAPKKSRKAKS